MKVVLKNEQVCVIDDLLPVHEFNRLWQGLQTEPFRTPQVGGTWQKVWRLTGGTPLKGSERSAKTGDYMDAAWDAFEEVRKAHREFLTKTKLAITSYIYPPGTKLAWHSDHGYGGTFTYYCHPRWSATWGGELLVALTRETKQRTEGLDHAWQDEFLLAQGHGLYIACKPNRLVLQKEGIWHAINRVDPDAGDNVRVSIVGFFRDAEAELSAGDLAQASEEAERMGPDTVLQKPPGIIC